MSPHALPPSDVGARLSDRQYLADHRCRQFDVLRLSDVRDATHVKVGNRDRFDRIAYKWGVENDGTLAAPSEYLEIVIVKR